MLGADGSPIITERPVYRIGIAKTTLDAAEADSSAVSWPLWLA